MTQSLRVAAILSMLCCLSASCEGCGSDDDDDISAGDDDTVDGASDPAIQALLEEFVAFSGEPGIAVAWTHDGGPPHTQTAGLASLQDGIPLDADSVFRVGSGTKPLLVAVLTQLVDEGVLGLDDPLGDILPAYPAWGDVTIRQLAGMRSGIPDYLFSQSFWLHALDQLGEPFTPEELLDYALAMESPFPPGEGCGYSNTNYVLLGLVIEQVTGRSAAQEMTTRLIEPLGLTSTFLDEEGAPLTTLAHGYADTELAGPVMGLDALLQALVWLIPGEFVLEGYWLDGTYMMHPTFAWTAGGLVSSPRDLATFMRAWVRGELASPAAMEEVLDYTDCVILGNGASYGLGIQSIETEYGEAIGHGGLHFGYETTNYHLPGTDSGFVITANYLPTQNALVVSELTQAIHEVPSPADEPCLPPDGFLEAEEDDLLQLRYRGPASATGEVGLAGSRFRLDGVWRAYHGFGAQATRDSGRLIVESRGPSRAPEWDLRGATLDLDEDLIGDLGPDGSVEIQGCRTDQVAITAYDVALEPAPDVLQRICLFAVPDVGEGVRFRFCVPGSSPPGEGDPWKFYASVPMTKEIDAIEEYAAELGDPRCRCQDVAGSWSEC